MKVQLSRLARRLKQITLQGCYPCQPQKTILVDRFDALCCGRYVETPGQSKSGRDDGGALRALGQVLDE